MKNSLTHSLKSTSHYISAVSVLFYCAYSRTLRSEDVFMAQTSIVCIRLCISLVTCVLVGVLCF